MSKQVSYTDPYPATPAQILAMVQDREYHAEKYVFLEDLSTEILEHKATDDGLSLEVDRRAKADLPDVARKVLGDNHIVQHESWRTEADGLSVDVRVDSPGKPLQIKGLMRVTPSGTGSDWFLDFDIKAKVPLVGGAIEGAVVKEFRASLARELEFNMAWLKKA